ncbi:MAG: cytochrome b/b6 domain-containing protein [Dissulfurispiraceae bacterium]
MQYRHPLPVRLMHWINVTALVVLLMSGLNIFNAHSILYWGESSYGKNPPLLEIRSAEDNEGKLIGTTSLFGYKMDTTGFLGASKDLDGDMIDLGFPTWITIPSVQWLAMARRWHFFFAWLLVVNGFTFVTYSLLIRHVARSLLPTRQELHSIGRSVVDHLLLRRPKGEEATRYNVLQKMAYLSVIFLMAPAMILMGLGMSPALDALFPGLVSLFGGRQSMRTLHFLIAWALVAFVFVHVFEVVVNGFWNNVRSMITGYFKVPPESDNE